MPAILEKKFYFFFPLHQAAFWKVKPMCFSRSALVAIAFAFYVDSSSAYGVRPQGLHFLPGPASLSLVRAVHVHCCTEARLGGGREQQLDEFRVVSPKGGTMHVSVNIEMNCHRTALVGFIRAPVAAAVARDPRGRLAFSALRMGGGNVPRVPYKAPGEQGYQVRN